MPGPSGGACRNSPTSSPETQTTSRCSRWRYGRSAISSRARPAPLEKQASRSSPRSSTSAASDPDLDRVSNAGSSPVAPVNIKRTSPARELLAKALAALDGLGQDDLVSLDEYAKATELISSADVNAILRRP